MPATYTPLISVVIAAYNAERTLARSLDSVLAQTYPHFELLVVDDGSTDATAEILRQHPRREHFQTLSIDNGGQSRARNLAVEAASGEWLAFFDADCLLEPDCLEALVRAVGEAEDVASVGGMQRSPADDSAFGKSIQRYLEGIGFMMDYGREGDEEVAQTQHNPSCCVLYRRAAFERLGGFDETLWVAEDPDLDRRATEAGYRHLVQPRAVVRHYRSPGPRAFAHKMRAYGRGQMMLVRRHGMHRRLHFVPVALLAAGAGAVVGLALWPRATVVGLLMAAGAFLVACERRRRLAGLGAVFYRLLWLNLVYWLTGFFLELFRPKLDGPARLHDFDRHRAPTTSEASP